MRGARQDVRRKPDIRWTSRRGTTLIEALVALAIITLAIAGASAAIAQSFSALEVARNEARARTELALRLDIGAPGSGPLDDEVLRGAEWAVTRQTMARAQLGGTLARWDRIEAIITWQRAGETRTLSAARVEIVADRPATP